MTTFLAYTIIGIVTGAGYAIAASGLVLTYTTSRIFNMAHGAMAMFAAFTYYFFAYQHGMNRYLAILLVVGVLAPIFGVVVERLLMRGLSDAPVNISLVVTVALFFLLYGGAVILWPPDKINGVTPLLPELHITIAGQTIVGNDLLTLITAAGVAVAFYLFFKRSRTGIAMRAVVDNRELLALHGAKPNFMSALSWAIGSALAALAGVLLVASIGLVYLDLTLLVITAYAAAILGKLENLPLTFVGALIIGLAKSYAVGYLPSGSNWNGLRVGPPAIILFLVLVLIPRAPLRVGQIRGIKAVNVPSSVRTALCGGALIVGAWLVSYSLTDSQNSNMSLAAVYACIMLSVVLLTGYAGYLNLAPITFAGIGALTMVKLGTDQPWALFVAAGITAVVGAVIGLLAIRLGTLYLAIATLAFAELMDFVVFQSSFGFKFGSLETVSKPNLFGYHVQSDQAFFVFTVVVFVALAALVLWLRRGPYGRVLIALRDSPAACGTLGLNLTATRVAVFAVSAAIAGFSGGVYAQQKPSIGAFDFFIIQNLPLMLALVIWGLTSVSGAALGGIFLMGLYAGPPLVAKYAGVSIAIAALVIGRFPNGLVSLVFALGRWLLGFVKSEQRAATPSQGSAPADQPDFVGVPEEVTVGGRA
ncbi:MAG: branched-chain amino acid transport system permease protein livM [Frankiales bacterium]|jgi:branched-chain amino acid transport system permease protein|nr:branched-chain amino acid transport system permease protein livM [Frankiales bacterium]